jgi:ATP-binding cassette subfamily C (CFTR/MRP) protein 10
LNKFIQAEYNSLATSQWLNFRLQMISVLMITIVGFTAVFQHIYSTANASLIGLALSYIMSVTGLLNGLITSFTETEKEMVSVERALQFDNIESEQWSGDLSKNNRSWMNKPIIEFKDVVLKYKNDANNALDRVNLRIEAGEKIGICGRTGSGKSSLFMSLFRGTELHSGSILIDNVNIRELDLEHLRQQMSIIPQDPFLFAGTLRENLDPSESKTDDELWQALRKCRLDEKFRQHVEGLNWLVEEKGKNLSTGEKQLICLARAVLSNRKILCIDEATASVDLETDNFVQQAIRNEFSNVTVLTIAHRINTIFDYDKIVVMSDGQIAEFDTVANLVSNKNSLFYSLLNEKENSLAVTK